jgi:MPBQ/MSBQ methyltransferase
VSGKDSLVYRSQMIAGYDRDMLGKHQSAYFGGSDFFNFGYWTPETEDQKEACEDLVDKLLSFIPEHRGIILDVACGLGATTRRLVSSYGAQNIVGINLSDVQLKRAWTNAPGCHFLLMDASSLAFPDESFDNVICVEAAFHFDTRDQFHREAFRVLKRGGTLVMSDILGKRLPRSSAKRGHLPEANYVEGVDEYRARLVAAGFEDIQLVDATQECWEGFCNSLKQWPGVLRRRGELGFMQAILASFVIYLGIVKISFFVNRYLLVAARRPLAET